MEKPSLHALLTKLSHNHGLSDDDQAEFGRLPLHEAAIASGVDVVRAGDQAKRCAVILEGLAFSYKLTGDGKRQILCFHLAGDMPDLQSLRFSKTDTGVATVSGCRVGYVPYAALRDLCSRHPSLADVLWRETLVQAAIVREWLLNVGQRDALAGLAHLICEMVVRQQAVGLTSNHSCSFPLTQTSLADALGLSTVHVNRTVQTLRADKLIVWQRQHLTVLDWERLRVVADFDPAYLHFGPEALAS